MLKKLFVAAASLSVALSALIFTQTTAFAGDCTVRDTVNWHATISSGVYLRTDCPSGDIIGTVPAGEVVEILEVDKYNEFYMVKTSVGTGFIFESFLKDITHSSKPGTSTQTFPDSIFIDLNPAHKYYDEIADVKEKGIVSGNPDGTIKADSSINRAELAKILVEATSDDETIASAEFQSGTYIDVQSGAWYLPYLEVARLRLIMVGDSGTVRTVRPAAGANGAEVAKMISVAFDLEVHEQESDEEWYGPYMDALDDLGALPYEKPDHVVTRGEMMFMISVVLEKS